MKGLPRGALTLAAIVPWLAACGCSEDGGLPGAFRADLHAPSVDDLAAPAAPWDLSFDDSGPGLLDQEVAVDSQQGVDIARDCGSLGQACCGGGCGAGAVCGGGVCVACGVVGQPCCDTCACGAMNATCGDSGQCVGAQLTTRTYLIGADGLVNLGPDCNQTSETSNCGANQQIGYAWTDTFAKVAGASITFQTGGVRGGGGVRAATLNGTPAGNFQFPNTPFECQPQLPPPLTMKLDVTSYLAGRADRFLWTAKPDCESLSPATLDGNPGVYAVVTVQGTDDGLVECPRQAVGSYNVHDGVARNQNPATLTCQETCALRFGGAAGTYSCSAAQGAVTRTANVATWGVNGCEVRPDNYKLGDYYDCGRVGCAVSAYVNDTCDAVNYCFR